MSTGDKWKIVQKHYGLIADGIPGDKTVSAILRDNSLEFSKVPVTEQADHRHINDKGLDMVKAFESLFLSSYKCSAGVDTIGWGHTGLTHKDGTVYPGRIITEKTAYELLAHDMEYFEKRVIELVKVDVSNDQFAALVSFCFNCGEGNLSMSSLLRELNSGDYDAAAAEFIKWNKARVDGDLVVLNGLTRRRASEERLFNGKDDPYIASVDEMADFGYTVV